MSQHRTHFKHMPVLRLYRMMKGIDPSLNLFRFAGALPPSAARTTVGTAIAFQIIQKASSPVQVRYHVMLPTVLATGNLNQRLTDGLAALSGATTPLLAQEPDYTGMKKFTRFNISSHDVAKVKVLSRTLQLKEWQVVTLLLSGNVENVSTNRSTSA